MGPLSILKTSTTSTAIPLIADNQMARLRVQELSLQEPEGERTYQQIKFKYTTLDPLPTSDGATVQPGFPIFQSLPLGTKDQPTVPPEWVAPAFCRFIDACLGTADAGNKKNKPARPEIDVENFPEFVGKEIIAIVKLKQSKNAEYGPSNQLANMQFPADAGL